MWWHIGLLGLDFLLRLASALCLNCCPTFWECRWSCESHPWWFCSWWGFWLAPLLSLNSRGGQSPFWPLGRDLLQSLPRACAGSALVRRCLFQSNLPCCSGNVTTLTSTLQLFLGYVQLFLWEVFGPSLWIPFSNSCFLLLAVYVIIPQLIFFSRCLWATQCCALFGVRSSFWCLYSQVKAAALWGTPEEHLQAWHLCTFSGRDLQRRIC